MARIFCRSPFYVSVIGVADDETTVELFIWNGTGPAPSDPTYTLSKPIPGSVLTQSDYNISPYLQEYISHNAFQNIYNTNNSASDTSEWCNVQVITYLNGVEDDNDTYKVYYGAGYFTEEMNPDMGFCLLREATYYYKYVDGFNYTTGLASTPENRAGSIMFEAVNGWSVKYTNLVTAATTTIAISATKIQDIYRVHPSYYEDGNKVEFIDGSAVVQKTYYFRPTEECKYEPVIIDFVNRYGAWHREFMFKATRNTFDVQDKPYILMQGVDYDSSIGTTKVFNKNGRGSISVNTGWVSEDWNETLKELMLSERILVNDLPCKLKTQNIDFNTHLNDKLINYKLEFEDAYETVNNI